MFQLTLIGEASNKVALLKSRRVSRNATTCTKIMARKNIQMYFKCHKCFINSPLCRFKKLFRIFKMFIFQNMI